jgi:hypothetical protein
LIAAQRFDEALQKLKKSASPVPGGHGT